MHLVQILLPRADNSGRPFPEQEFDKVKVELAREFDGVTAYLRAPAEGLWKQGQNASHDDIVIFEVMADEMNLHSWRERRGGWSSVFAKTELSSDTCRWLCMRLVIQCPPPPYAKATMIRKVRYYRYGS